MSQSNQQPNIEGNRQGIEEGIKQRILSLDLGEKMIGCAICDKRQVLVSPLPALMVDNQIHAVAPIRKLIENYHIKKVLIGIPYLLDGAPTTQTKKYLTFGKKLKKHLADIQFEFIDETLSTWSVKKNFKKLKLKKDQNQVNIDSFCAVEMLNQYLQLEQIPLPDSE